MTSVIFQVGCTSARVAGRGLQASSDTECQEVICNKMHLTMTRVHNLAASCGRRRAGSPPSGWAPDAAFRAVGSGAAAS